MLWRITPARSRRLPPAGFFQSARPMLAPKPRAGPDWIHEAKHDGYRLLARKNAGRVTLWSRYGADFTTDKLPRIVEAVPPCLSNMPCSMARRWRMSPMAMAIVISRR
jgi:ATP-dependent DNA ligase